MSTLAPPRPSTKQLIGGEPRVQLLPPSVRERERVRASMRLAVLLVVLGVVVGGAIVALGFLRQVSTDLALQAANARTTQLLAERAQYAEATEVADTIAGVEETQKTMTSYEIDLAALLGDLQSRLGPGMAITQMSVKVQAPWGVPLSGEDVLAPPRIANLELTVTSSTIAEGTAFRNALATLEGYSSATLLDTAVGTDGTVTTHLKLALATGAVSGRFDESASDDAAGTDGSTESATAGADGEEG